MTILDQLAEHARQRAAADAQKVSLGMLRELAQEKQDAPGAAFREALQKDDLSFICEVKKASPSKGIISPDFPYLDIARRYEAAGADGISCLTEPKWFLGSDEIFCDIRSTVATPMLRKDFTVDPYQIYQARVMGANAILLICAILDTPVLAAFLDLARQLGMAALVEAHNAEEIRAAVSAGAGIIGVNNRNLKDFSVDFANAARLRDCIPVGTLYVAESGVTGPADAAELRRMGADAALVGEALMRSEDPGKMLQAMRAAAL